MKKGDLFIFIHEHDSNWWKMQAEDGFVGLVPASYLEPDESEMASTNKLLETKREWLLEDANSYFCQLKFYYL